MAKYTVSDGKMVLTLQEEGGWFVVTSPTDPALITQARTVREAFKMARDAVSALADSRRDTRRWEKTGKRKLKRSA
jgi:antitoxin HicB